MRQRSTMAQWTKWTKMSLFLMLVLQFRVITGQESFLIVRVGDEATLSCENRIKNQDKCDSTNWVFNDQPRSPSVELISLGQIGENAASKSDGLRVTESCSLVIKKVTVNDAGRYTCRQYRSDKEQGQASAVRLSVINIHEVKNSNEMILTCTVLTYEHCPYKVQWLYVGKKEDFRELQKSQSTCSATVTLETTHLNQKSKHEESYKCNVTDSRSGKQLLYNFSSQPSSISNENKTTPPNKDTSDQPGFPSLWLGIIVVVIVAALVIIVGALIRQRRTNGKRNKMQMADSTGVRLNPDVTQSAPETSQDTADPEDGVSYASISYIKKTNSKAWGKGGDADDEGDAVTYSTLKVSSSSSSAGASTDPDALYTTVITPNK